MVDKTANDLRNQVTAKLLERVLFHKVSCLKAHLLDEIFSFRFSNGSVTRKLILRKDLISREKRFNFCFGMKCKNCETKVMKVYKHSS